MTITLSGTHESLAFFARGVVLIISAARTVQAPRKLEREQPAIPSGDRIAILNHRGFDGRHLEALLLPLAHFFLEQARESCATEEFSLFAGLPLFRAGAAMRLNNCAE